MPITIVKEEYINNVKNECCSCGRRFANNLNRYLTFGNFCPLCCRMANILDENEGLFRNYKPEKKLAEVDERTKKNREQTRRWRENHPYYFIEYYQRSKTI